MLTFGTCNYLFNQQSANTSFSAFERTMHEKHRQMLAVEEHYRMSSSDVPLSTLKEECNDISQQQSLDRIMPLNKVAMDVETLDSDDETTHKERRGSRPCLPLLRIFRETRKVVKRVSL